MSQVNHVVFVGGTHGNELTGVYLINKLSQPSHAMQSTSFTTQTLLANPEAVSARMRYIDSDLNRSFSDHSLENINPKNYESLRAKQIADIIGPQGHPPADVIVDLHSTTSNMGLTLIIDREEPFTLQLAAHLQQVHPGVRIYSTTRSGRNQDALRSLARFGFCIEVGPVAQGVLNADLFLQTQSLVYVILDYLEQYNQNPAMLPNRSLTLYRYVEAIDYPRDAQGEILAMIHPQLQFRDYQPLHPGDPMFLTFAGETIDYAGETTTYPVFINEAAYYEKGIALCLTQQEEIVI